MKIVFGILVAISRHELGWTEAREYVEVAT